MLYVATTMMKVVKLMKEAFPELLDAEKRVMDILEDEEMAFNRTLDKGLKEFNKVAAALGDSKSVSQSVSSTIL